MDYAELQKKGMLYNHVSSTLGKGVSMLGQLKIDHADIFNSIWNHPTFTPQEIFDTMTAEQQQTLFTVSRAIQELLVSQGHDELVIPCEFTFENGKVVIQ